MWHCANLILFVVCVVEDNRFGEDNGTHYIDFMDLFYHNMSNAYSQRVPVMMSPGNHEVRTPRHSTAIFCVTHFCISVIL